MRFIKITQTDKNKYIVLTKKDDVSLGEIIYFDLWHTFIFVPEGGTFYDTLCMIEIGDYIGLLKKVE